MKIPQLTKKPELKSCHNVNWEDNYSWIHQNNILEVLKDPSKLLPDVKTYIDENNLMAEDYFKDVKISIKSGNLEIKVKENPLIQKRLREVSVEEGMEIATELFQILNKRGDGIGLAANQVGIDAQVAVVNVREPLVLINPKIIEKHNEIPFYEGCLSYPGKGVHTKRYRDVVIQTAQSESGWYFSGAENPSDGKGSWEESSNKKQDEELRLLEAICVQHEIDHLNGMTIMDRQMITTVVSKDKFGRNEKVMITDGNETKELKWKKAKPLVESGKWEIYVGGPIT